MGRRPAKPKIYHITHVNNLVKITASGALYSDALMRRQGGPQTTIGMDEVKADRLGRPVPCHPGTVVGDYVPFYFCPRSVMLYVLYRSNHPNLTYRGGQGPILHLECDLHEVVEWANSQRRRWAFTLSNAAAHYTEFRNRLEALTELNWNAIAASIWSQEVTKEGKQAEFLMHEKVPWEFVRHIGVHSADVLTSVRALLGSSDHIPSCTIETSWYY